MGQFAYLTGQRRIGFLKLPLSALGTKGISFKTTKNRDDEGHTVVIQWTPALEAIVKEYRALPHKVKGLFYLFTNQKGETYTEQGFKANWNKLQQRWAAAGNRRFHFHDLLSAHVGAKKDRGEAAKDSRGHKTEATADRIYDRRRVRYTTPAE